MPSKKIVPNIQLITKPPKNRFCSVFAFFSGLSIGILTILVLVYGYWLPNACNEPVNGAWSNWGSWGECIQLCNTNEEFETRSRTCTNPLPAGTGSGCIGEKAEYRSCSGAHICAGGTGWTLWTEWSACSSECDQGNTTRSRECKVSAPQDESCIRTDTENKTCQNICTATTNDVTATDNARKSNQATTVYRKDSTPHEATTIPVSDAGIPTLWTDWETWSNCSALCGIGNQTRQRTCNNIMGDCEGLTEEYQQCVTNVSCEVHCLGGYTASSGYCFKHYTNAVSWAMSVNKCQDESAQLVVITDDLKLNAVQDYFTSLAAEIPATFWIDASYQLINGIHKVYTASGEVSDLHQWMPAAPNIPSDAEGCIFLETTETYKWNVKNCEETASFLCEKHGTFN